MKGYLFLQQKAENWPSTTNLCINFPGTPPTPVLFILLIKMDLIPLNDTY